MKKMIFILIAIFTQNAYCYELQHDYLMLDSIALGTAIYYIDNNQIDSLQNSLDDIYRMNHKLSNEFNNVTSYLMSKHVTSDTLSNLRDSIVGFATFVNGYRGSCYSSLIAYLKEFEGFDKSFVINRLDSSIQLVQSFEELYLSNYNSFNDCTIQKPMITMDVLSIEYSGYDDYCCIITIKNHSLNKPIVIDYNIIDTDGMYNIYQKTYDSLSYKIDTLCFKPRNQTQTLFAQAYFENDSIDFQDTKFIELDQFDNIIQEIYLLQGWNMVSSYVKPINNEIDSLTKEIITNLVLIKNNYGQVYFPLYEINEIVNWDFSQAYQIYMYDADTLRIPGQIIQHPERKIQLKSGWNLISYINPTILDVGSTFDSLVQSENLVIMKDNNGKIYFPMYGIDIIRDLLPGQGYYLYLKNNTTFTYP